MYYPDLSPYSYPNSDFPQKLKAQYGLSDDTQFLNVGWLDAAFAFETETPNAAFLDKLFERVKRSENMFRGLHYCPFCPVDNLGYNRTSVVWNGVQHDFGCTETFVLHGKTVFIAPDLVFHYIQTHSYKPPQVFHDAVLSFGIQRAKPPKPI